jgi:hypothetical protein
VPLDEVQPFNVFIYPSTADLGSAMRLAGQEWQPGRTYPELGVLLVTAVNPATAEGELAAGIGRELTDLLLYQALGDNYGRVPQWVRSGLGELAAGDVDARSAALLAEAVADGRTLPFDELCAGFPSAQAELAIAEAQSGSILRSISDQAGPEAVLGLVNQFAAGATCEEALATALSSTPTQVEQAWLAAFQPTDPQRVQISQAIIWVLLILLGFGMAGLLVWRAGGNRARR